MRDSKIENGNAIQTLISSVFYGFFSELYSLSVTSVESKQYWLVRVQFSIVKAKYLRRKVFELLICLSIK